MPPRTLSRRLLYSALATLLFLAGAEALVRLTYPVVRSATLPDTMIRDHLKTTGFVYHPDLYWYWAFLPSAAMQVNEYGFRRARPMTFEKPVGTRRVVTLGDSQTLGAGVDVESSYSAVAERELGQGWEVLNAGISGYRSLNVLRLLKLRIKAFAPDAIVVDCMPFDSARDDGELTTLPIGASTSRLKGLLWHSQLYRLARLGLEKLDSDRARWLDRPAVPKNGIGLGNHDLIMEWARKENVEVFFMQYPVMQHGRIDCQTQADELPPGARVIPACDALQADGRAASELFQDMNHMTEAGNEVVGALLARVISESLGP